MICFFYSIINFTLAVVKLIFGFSCNSSALLSDGMHSLADVVLNICSALGIKLKGKYEPIMGIVLATVLITVAGAIMMKGVFSIFELSSISNIALIFTAVCIIIKEMMFVASLIASKKQNSLILSADAWHQQSDAFANIGVFIGIFGSKLGIFWLEPLSSFAICVIITIMAIKIFKQSAEGLECSNS